MEKKRSIKAVKEKKPGNIVDGKFKACGHEASLENVYRRKDGYAQCKECVRINKCENNKKRTRAKQFQGAMI